MQAQDLSTIVRLFEARGLGARRPGEEFVGVTDPGQRIYVDSVKFYPATGGQYPDAASMQAELNRIQSALKRRGVPVQNTAEFTKKSLAFGVAIFDTAEGGKLAYVKPFDEVNADPTRNTWDNQKGIPGYKFNSAASRKAKAGLTPQDILTTLDNLKPIDIVRQIKTKYGDTSPLTLLAANISRGAKFPLTIAADPDMSFPAFRDYFCELLHPIALMHGTYTGNAARAAEKFLGPGGYKDTVISFSKSTTEGLSDSIMVSPEGFKIKVSSKGEKGADASTTSLLDAAEELRDSDPKLYRRLKKTVDLIHTMRTAGQYKAPLVLGVQYDIITKKDADIIELFKNQAPAPLQLVESMKISKNLKKLIKERGAIIKDPSKVNFYLHSISAVAHKVANYINENTNFGEDASKILNNAALVQVYTEATEEGTNWVITNFFTKWPSDAVSGVTFSARKNYSSTNIKGNFTFKVLRNGAEDTEDDDPELRSAAEVPAKMRDRSAPKPQSAKAKPEKTGVGRGKLK